MQKILIPTDFSPIADNALNYAIEIAYKFESKLVLYHVFSFNRKVDHDWDFPYEEQPYIKNIEQKMNFAKLKFKEKVTQKGLSIQGVVEEDNIFSLFKQKVIKHDIDMIIMGSKGATDLNKVIFGSVAATAIEMAKIPVLVVPPKHYFLPFKHIVLATDSNEVSTSVLLPLQKLAFEFGAKVTILNVNTEPAKDKHHKMEFDLKAIETTYCEVPVSKSINESINKFVKKSKCDLLCMIRREKGFFESFFQKSITKTQVYSNKIPLLVLPEK